MTSPPDARLFRVLPKIELHRHLEGALRLSTLVALADEYNLPLPRTEWELRPLVQMTADQPRSWQQFLSKFPILRHFFCSEAVIRRITREAVADAADDGIHYMELRFAPAALANRLGCPFADVIAWVCEEAAGESTRQGMQVGLMVLVNRHESVTLAQSVFDAAFEFAGRGVVAVDLAGREPDVDIRPFGPLFERARGRGLGVTIHAGEWTGAQSIWDVLDVFAPERIGHGVRAADEPALMRELARRGVVLEVCPSSNVDSGVVASLAQHPLPVLLNAGVRVTLNTDDPGISDITLSEEFERVQAALNLPFETLRHMTTTAAEAAFLPAESRRALAVAFSERWKETPA